MKSTSVFRLYRLPLELSSWLVFIISLSIYWVTSDPGVSYWDCPEYVTAASKLEVNHPPGNPIWMLIMRVLTIPFPIDQHAYVINLCSGICMAFASFFLCRLIFIPIRLSLENHRHEKDNKNFYDFLTCIIAIGGAFCFAFCDSAWFSAVEAEVYSMSVMLTSLTLWLMMVWWFERSRSHRLRLLILIAYIIGLSIGVHQLNLLCIPVLVLIYFYKENPEKVNPILVLAWILLGCGIVALILLILMPGSLYLAQLFELFFVNKLSAPFDTGVLIFIFSLFAFFIVSICLTQKLRQFGLNTILWMTAFILLGYSSFGVILIRAKAMPFMNEGVPSDIFALSSYINRDQYPSSPLLYGQTPYSKAMYIEKFEDNKPTYKKYALEKGKPIYIKDTPGAIIAPRSGFFSSEDSTENKRILHRNPGGYVLSDYFFTQKLTPELNMWFPRITSLDPSDRKAYADWAGMTEETMQKVPISEAFDSIGSPVTKLDSKGKRIDSFSYRPSYLQQVRYFLTYQSFFMYFRYLLWNFMGKQNDYPSQGEIEHGNFITGFKPIDSLMIGNTDQMPDEIWEDNPGHNNYYSIPFILGLIGAVWLIVKSRSGRRIDSVIFLLFLMSGLAIVFYVNQSPGEPRERDYSFLGSYLAIAMWIAAGITFIIKLLMKFRLKRIVMLLSIIVTLFPATLMAVVNFDDHDRMGRFETSFYASSILDNETPSVIFSHGDNSTFPLWYASEVLNMGKEHTPVDVTYLSLPSYVVNLKQQKEKRLETIAEIPQIAYGAFQFTKIPVDSLSKPMPLKEALSSLYTDNNQPPSLPTSLIEIPIHQGDTITINLHDFTGGSSYLPFRQLMLLDILATQFDSPSSKALFFPNNIGRNFYKPLDPLLIPVFYGKILLPNANDSIAHNLLEQSMERELTKLKTLKINPHYSDPTVADMSRRYRGELIIGAKELFERGNSDIPQRVIDIIETKFPYTDLLPGTFTLSDTTYYEGKEYLYLLKDVYEETANPHYKKLSDNHNQLLEKRKQEWVRYYNSLSPQQRKTLSPRSLRNLL